MRYVLLMLCCLSGLACSLSIGKEDSTPASTSLPTPMIAIIPTIASAPALPVRDATPIVSGICFEALQTLDGQSFVLESDTALREFYAQLEGLCPEPITRTGFDFSREILVLVFKSAQACTVEFVPQSIAQNVLMLQWRQTGSCAYEVVAVYAGALDRAYQGLQVNLSGA